MTAAQLQARRKAIGLSQAELAARLGLSVDNIQNWEQGRYRVPALLDAALRELERQADPA